MNATTFPVDDLTLDMLEAAMDGTLMPDLGRSCVNEFLDFMSGYDPSQVVPFVGEDGHEHDDITEYVGGSIFHEHDVIRALIAEVRRLRD